MSTARQEQELADTLRSSMLTKLRANAHKTHWLDTPRDTLMRGLLEEMHELEAAIERGHPTPDVWAEAADVANFAAMLAAHYEGRK